MAKWAQGTYSTRVVAFADGVEKKEFGQVRARRFQNSAGTGESTAREGNWMGGARSLVLWGCRPGPRDRTTLGWNSVEQVYSLHLGRTVTRLEDQSPEDLRLVLRYSPFLWLTGSTSS